jgi:hypothetical protein
VAFELGHVSVGGGRDKERVSDASGRGIGRVLWYGWASYSKFIPVSVRQTATQG